MATVGAVATAAVEAVTEAVAMVKVVTVLVAEAVGAAKVVAVMVAEEKAKEGAVRATGARAAAAEGWAKQVALPEGKSGLAAAGQEARTVMEEGPREAVGRRCPQ